MSPSADMTLQGPPSSSPGAAPTFTVWVRALRLYSITASIVPVLFGELLGFPTRDSIGLLLALPAVLAGIFLHLGTNLINDVGDFESGVDRTGSSMGSGVLVEGILTAKQVRRAAYACFAVAIILGLALLPLRGLPLLGLGVAGFLGGWGYTAGPKYKYLGLGDVCVFFLMGPLMVLGGYFMLTGHLSWAPVLSSLPIGALVVAIMHANNLRDLASDKAMGLHTMAIWLGPRRSIVYYDLLILGAYVSLAVLVGMRVLPYGAALALLSLPVAAKLARGLAAAAKADTLQSAMVVERTAQLHLLFGLLLIVGTAVGFALGAHGA